MTRHERRRHLHALIMTRMMHRIDPKWSRARIYRDLTIKRKRWDNR